ncbi:uncharacterized protein LY89DRAFT_784033 [Mollisia scopiformis]|uniref:Uncharacterized protein n=1 Tax=Mollisia scopiformis TaxID=149040 RepID=A0A194X497_MOLSC|nr:uncharacterized protein LY89DRAFT_784033 [Mollisia scopiformis]KUJ14996.1 hypothetical protein LY89DRAFT_784033 [Mollisia scopiformis]
MSDARTRHENARAEGESTSQANCENVGVLNHHPLTHITNLYGNYVANNPPAASTSRLISSSRERSQSRDNGSTIPSNNERAIPLEEFNTSHSPIRAADKSLEDRWRVRDLPWSWRRHPKFCIATGLFVLVIVGAVLIVLHFTVWDKHSSLSTVSETASHTLPTSTSSFISTQPKSQANTSLNSSATVSKSSMSLQELDNTATDSASTLSSSLTKTNSLITTEGSSTTKSAALSSTCTPNCLSPSTTSSTIPSTTTHIPITFVPSTTSTKTSNSQVRCTVDSDCPSPSACEYSASTCFICTYATSGAPCNTASGCCDPFSCIGGTCISISSS